MQILSCSLDDIRIVDDLSVAPAVLADRFPLFHVDRECAADCRVGQLEIHLRGMVQRRAKRGAIRFDLKHSQFSIGDRTPMVGAPGRSPQGRGRVAEIRGA